MDGVPSILRCPARACSVNDQYRNLLIAEDMGANVVEPVQAQILDSLHAWYPDLNHGDYSLVNVQEKRFRWSHHFTFEVRDERGCLGPRILAKLSRSHEPGGDLLDVGPAPNALMLEYQALSLLYERLGGNRIEGVTAVRALTYLTDANALILEHMPGRDLLAQLLSAGRPWAKQSVVQVTAKAANRGGRLLGLIHCIERGQYPRRDAFNSKKYYRRLHEKTETLLGMVSEVTVRERLLPVKQAVSKLALDVREDVTITNLHGDLNPDNLVQLPDGRVYTIDTTLHQPGCVEEDLAVLLVGIDMLKQKLLAGALAIRSSNLDVVKQSFLDGYSVHAQFSSRILLLYEVLALVQRWIEVLDLLAQKAPRIIATAIERRRINPLMLAHLDHIWRDAKKEWQLS